MKKLFLIISFLFISSTPKIGLKAENKEKELLPISYENLYEEILRHGIKFPDVVFAQAVLETGHFTSKLFQDANNLFGMRMPSKRETLAVGVEKRGFAVFPHWTTSVNDYFLWQEYVLRNKNIKTKNDYLALLNRIYATDKRYVSLLNKVISKHQHIFK